MPAFRREARRKMLGINANLCSPCPGHLRPFREQGPHALDSTDARCASYRPRTAAFSGFAMNTSRSFHVIAAKRRHSFPPIWLKMILVNLPSAVRRLACARTPFAALTADVVFIATRLLRIFAFVCFLTFAIHVPSKGTGIDLPSPRRRKLKSVQSVRGVSGYNRGC